MRLSTDLYFFKLHNKQSLPSKGKLLVHSFFPMSAFTIRKPQSPEELAAGLKLRQDIFVEEQEIPRELDEDGKDETSIHVIALNENAAIIGYGRLSPNGSHGVLSRIAIHTDYRGHGLGKQIVMALDAHAVELGLKKLSLSPHVYLERFYASLGYQKIEGSSGRVGPNDLIEMEKTL